jgi:cellulose synthase/poly-beta-1,6-N-acetylglucosamine synthase-like glycosyltransferase
VRRRLTPPALATAALAGSNAYLLGLLVAAAARRPREVGATGTPGRMRFAVLVPARDEEATIATTLTSLRRLDYPRDRLQLIVIADNCTDATASVAANAGATVWRREDAADGGKGAAIAWALARMQACGPDCEVSPNLLTAVEARMRSGAAAVQVAYGVANPDASWLAALRYASFALVNVVRPCGKTALGLSCGLFGTGMGFTRGLLERHQWTARSLVEDQDYHLQIVAAGERVTFAPEAWVRSPMPTTLRRARSQQLRWDAGRAALIRRYTPRLLRLGLCRRDPARLHAALEPLVPPQSLLLAANTAGLLLALRAPSRRRRLAVANAASQAGFVVGGLSLAGAPAAVWRALALAPALAVWKLTLLARLWAGRGPTDWVRTEREPSR